MFELFQIVNNLIRGDNIIYDTRDNEVFAKIGGTSIAAADYGSHLVDTGSSPV